MHPGESENTAGSIKKRGDRTWRVRVFSRDADGNRASHSHTVHGIKEDA